MTRLKSFECPLAMRWLSYLAGERSTPPTSPAISAERSAEIKTIVLAMAQKVA
jgi:hypothetical protein